ncbi:hypothetical protein COOONC_23705, partial [Cooperia oncophora]
LVSGANSESTSEAVLQAESLAFEKQNSEVNVRSSRDRRGQLHAIRDDVAKAPAISCELWHDFAKVNALVRQGDDDALEALSRVADRMRILADDIDVPLGSTAILPRPDVSSGGRPKLQKAELYTRARIRKQMRKISQSAEDLRIDPEEILFCSLCFEEHPDLPERNN